VVLERRDTPGSYHLCVTHDDWRQGVSLVTRGEDLLPSTDLHRLIQALMGWPAPAYAHHPLMRDDAGRRLAKRDHATTLKMLRVAGVTPAEVRALAGFPA
jgi:glutamyl-Q tRNA(Asp) synthetase